MDLATGKMMTHGKQMTALPLTETVKNKVEQMAIDEGIKDFKCTNEQGVTLTQPDLTAGVDHDAIGDTLFQCDDDDEDGETDGETPCPPELAPVPVVQEIAPGPDAPAPETPAEDADDDVEVGNQIHGESVENLEEQEPEVDDIQAAMEELETDCQMKSFRKVNNHLTKLKTKLRQLKKKKKKKKTQKTQWEHHSEPEHAHLHRIHSCHASHFSVRRTNARTKSRL